MQLFFITVLLLNPMNLKIKFLSRKRKVLIPFLSLFSSYVYATEDEFDLFIEQKHYASITLNSINDQTCLKIKKIWEPSKILDALQAYTQSRQCVSLDDIGQEFQYRHVIFKEFHSIYLVKEKITQEKQPTEIEFGQIGAFLNYDVSYTNEKRNEIALFFTDEEVYHQYSQIKLDQGINFSDLAFRSSIKKDEFNQWNIDSASLLHVLPDAQARLLVGDEFAIGRLFDASNRTGISVQTEDRLLINQRTVLPIVQGSANSDAEVSIMQGQSLVLRRRVKPGVFRFTDIVLPNGNAPVFVVVRESNGATTTTPISLQQLPTIINEDQFWFEAFVGKTKTDPLFDFLELPIVNYSQVSAIYGLNQYLSVFGGSQLSTPYQSYQAGLGANLYQLGMFSSGLTASASDFKDESKNYHGMHSSSNYSNTFFDNKLTLSHTTDVYLNEGYLTLSDYQNYASPYSTLFSSERDMSSNPRYTFRTRFEYQGAKGSASLDHNNQISIAKEKTDIYTANASYFGFDAVNLNASLMYYKTPYFEDHSINIGVSFSFANSITADLRANNTKQKNKYTTELYGSTENDTSYSILWENEDNQYGGSLSTKHQFGETLGSYQKQIDGNITQFTTTGAVAFHPKGISFGDIINDQYAVLCLDKFTQDMPLLQTSRRKIDSQGCMLISSLTAYQENTLLINRQIEDPHSDESMSNPLISLTPTERAFLFKNIK